MADHRPLLPERSRGGDSYDSQTSQWSEPAPGRLFTRYNLESFVAAAFVLALFACVLVLSLRDTGMRAVERFEAQQGAHERQVNELRREIQVLQVQIGMLTNELVRVEQNRPSEATPQPR